MNREEIEKKLLEAPKDKWRGYRVFIDDMRPIPDKWIGARTVSEAIAILATLHPIREISLDHDILFPAQRVDQYTPLMNETFKGVAHYIAKCPDLLEKAKIRIHSSNAGGAYTMCAIMGLDFQKAYKPFNHGEYD